MGYIHPIGESFSEKNRPQTFELVLDDHIQAVHPKTFGIKEEFIDPRRYFITSGDAIQKARVLEQDLWQLAARLRKRVIEQIQREHRITQQEARKRYNDGCGTQRPKRLRDYEQAIWTKAGHARRLMNQLKKARGDNCFLETEWDDHRLLCIPKNPRR